MKILGRLFGLALVAVSLLTACEQPEIKEPVKIRLNKELMSGLSVGATQQLEVTVTPADAKVTLVWASDNESVAVVDDQGNVTGVAPGTAEVSVAADEAVAKCKVNVLAPKPQDLSLDFETFEMTVGQELQLQATITPDGALADDLTWSSSNKSVATVKDGKVTAVSEGKAVITVSCNGGKLTAECEVTVVKEAEEKVLVSSIKMSSELELKVGASSVLSVVVLPENAYDKTVTYTVEGDCVSVDQNGKVVALEEGVAVVTATANDGSGVKAECKVTVTVPDPDDVTITAVVLKAEGNTSDVQVNKDLQLYLECIPEDAVPNTVSWTVDNPALAQVDQNGVVSGVGAVKDTDNAWTKVVVTVNADGVQASLSLRVIPRQPEEIVVDLPENNRLRVGQEWYFNPRVLPEGLGYKVYCTSSMPNGHSQNDPYGVYVSGVPGNLSVTFAVSDHENLVYTGYRKDVHLSVIPYWVETVSLPETQEMEQGTSMSLNPVFTSDVEGVQPTYKDVKWSSSDPSVATINENTGEITALAAGQTNITVTTANSWSVPGGQEQKSATCVLTVKAAEVTLNVGDYFYSDGTWSSELKSGKTVVGIVFAKANAVTSDPVLANDFPGCTHGLVLGLTEYADQDFGAVSTYNGHGYYAGLGYDASLIVNEKKPIGYGNSKAHKDLNASKSDYVTLFNAESGVIATQTSAVATPSNASTWYVPSYREMEMIHENYDVINAALEAAGGQLIAAPYEREESFDAMHSSDWYWTSTIYGKPYNTEFDHYKYAFDISKGAWTTSQQASAKCKVRVVFAF